MSNPDRSHSQELLDLPFNRHLGLTLTRHNEDEVVCLEPAACHLNHLGTIHAGALYSLAEAASGHALLTRLKLQPPELFAVVRTAKVKYRKPASGRVIGVAETADDVISKCIDQLKAKGRALVDIPIKVVDGKHVEVLTGEFSWFVSQVETS